MDRLQNTSLFQPGCFINGKVLTSDDGEPIENPHNQELLGYTPNLADQDVEAAIESAAMAQKSWAQQTAYVRSETLMRWYHLILKHKKIG